MIRRTSEITYYFLLFRFALHLVFRGDMNHMMKDLENVMISQPAVSFSANCLLVMLISKQNMEEFVFAVWKKTTGFFI